ncbi:MAG TPA: phosphoglucosamine mutase [Eggerthellaceae bacterium]|nr:phosphoglucosamine mutase [Eggerthellaceae bacterium]
MARMFGTDGVRGVANIDLTCPLSFRLGQAAVRFQGPRILVGRDTRLSGDMLEAAVCSGIMSMRGTALVAGVIPTPAIALLVKQLGCDGGVVISASHNPPEYNGIKLFDGQGFKLPDEVEDRIQEAIESGTLDEQRPAGDAVGTIQDVPDAVDRYVNHAVESVRSQGIDLSGMKIALDCGHGASCVSSLRALKALGADVQAINDDFTGLDINVQCGSTNLDPLKRFVSEIGADAGIAHDGDADRVMLVDSQGNEIDGDMMEAVLAMDMKERGCLPHDTAVSTVMCNLGFVRCMEEQGIQVVQTKVGDRYVLEEMRDKGYAIGGEQSGHLILLDYNSTGDGLMTAVQFLAAVRRSGKTADDAAKVFRRYPQELINVRVSDKEAVFESEAVKAAEQAAREAMGKSGRVLLRPSGTEPVVRVMVEAASDEDAKRHCKAIADVVAAELGID